MTPMRADEQGGRLQNLDLHVMSDIKLVSSLNFTGSIYIFLQNKIFILLDECKIFILLDGP